MSENVGNIAFSDMSRVIGLALANQIQQISNMLKNHYIYCVSAHHAKNLIFPYVFSHRKTYQKCTFLEIFKGTF